MLNNRNVTINRTGTYDIEGNKHTLKRAVLGVIQYSGLAKE